MRQSHSRVLIGLIFGVLGCAAAASAADSQTVSVQRLSDRVLVASAPLLGPNNVVAVATRKGLVLIDTGVCPFVAGQLKQEIEKQLGRKDWAYVFNTHVHDHTGGNLLYKGVPIIGHENTVEDSKRLAEALASEEKKAPSVKFIQGKIQEVQKQLESGAANGEALRAQLAFWQAIEGDLKGFEVVAPSLRFTEDLTLDMGDATFHALYVGRGHSLSDIVIHVPEEKLLVAGSSCGPFFPKIGDTVRLADLNRSVAVLDQVLQGGVEHVVPSHAEAGGRDIAERRRDYYRDLLAGVKAAQRDGLTLEKAQSALGLEQLFPYMRDAKVFQGTREEAHAANVATVWKLVQE
jgi:glyoxylase-like metal-dependent hydrolase (beta-lactamase superfamily II)